MQEIKIISLSEINLEDETHKFRDHMDLEPLVESMKLHGQKVPVFLRKKGETYQIISGFRRVSALQEAEIDEVTAILWDALEDDKEALITSLIENEARKNYTDLEKGYAIVRYKELGVTNKVRIRMKLTT